MVAIWPTTNAPDFPFNDGLLVTDDHMNQILDNLDDLDTRVTTVASAVNNGTSGNTALNTRVTSLEGVTSNAGTTGSGNATLSTRLGTGVTTASTATSQFAAQTSAINAINTNLGTWSGGTAISRIGALETKTASYRGQWKAANVLQDFAHGGQEAIILNTVVGSAPTGITNNNNGTWTVNQAGVWLFSLTADLDFNTAPASGFMQEWLLNIVGPAGTIAGNQFAWNSNAGTAGTATGFAILSAGAVITAYGQYWRSGGAAGGPFYLAGVDRTNFSAIRLDT